MNWNNDRSITLSKVCVFAFSLLLAAADIGAYPLVRWFIGLRGMNWQEGTGMMICLYLCSIFAWIALFNLLKLLGRIGAGEVFISSNVKSMRIISWCCVAVAAVCLVSGIVYLPFILVAMAAGFMALIVRIVKNAFQQAVEMKDELDLTV